MYKHKWFSKKNILRRHMTKTLDRESAAVTKIKGEIIRRGSAFLALK